MVYHLFKRCVHPAVHTHADVAAHEATEAHVFRLLVCLLAHSHVQFIRVPFSKGELVLLSNYLLGNDRCLSAPIVLERDSDLPNMCNATIIIHGR